ncbi:MAG: flagellar assembly protein FliH [Epsilonproteobacteria bacterium]|nr:flagellar assembly protein FliH [Campylobacterota bacterium]
MAKIIDSDSIEKHNVQKYNFKVIALGSQEESGNQEVTVAVEPQLTDETIDSSSLSSGTKDSLIESLMKKTDEMSSNFIKLQMKYEQKEQEYKEELEKVRKEAYELGIETGKAQSQEELAGTIENSLAQYSATVKKLEAASSEFQSSLESVKEELVAAALDIAKEVIKVEVSQNSSEIAVLLTKELIKDLQGAAKITLKVNPKDHSVISQELGQLQNITILSDSAISEGGVVVMSDAGNIDAQIQKRFERVKKAALSE